jgi:hypothetical protein
MPNALRSSTLKRSRAILTLSLLLNGILLGVLAYREVNVRIQRMSWESESPGWAKYAGAMQAVADYGNGVRRLYRATLAKDAGVKASFTGQVDRGAEVWTWIYYEEMGDASRAAAAAFTEAYNARMLNFMKDPGAYSRNGVAARRRAE